MKGKKRECERYFFLNKKFSNRNFTGSTRSLFGNPSHIQSQLHSPGRYSQHLAPENLDVSPAKLEQTHSDSESPQPSPVSNQILMRKNKSA